MKEKIQEIIERNSFTEDQLENPMLVARIALAAYGCQYDGKYHQTFGLYQGETLVAKVNMPKPGDNPWFAVGYIYESPRVANVAGFVIDFEDGLFKGNAKELGLSDGDTWKTGYDFEAKFDSIKILTGTEKLTPGWKKVEAYG